MCIWRKHYLVGVSELRAHLVGSNFTSLFKIEAERCVYRTPPEIWAGISKRALVKKEVQYITILSFPMIWVSAQLPCQKHQHNQVSELNEMPIPTHCATAPTQEHWDPKSHHNPADSEVKLSVEGIKPSKDTKQKGA